MADEIKDQRIITLMTPTEVEAIDEWSFKNRIRSRGEAIRRLCAIGLEEQRRAPERKKRLRSVAFGMKEIFERFQEAREVNNGEIDEVIVDAVYRALLTMMTEVFRLLNVSIDAHTASRILSEAAVDEMLDDLAAQHPLFERLESVRAEVVELMESFEARRQKASSKASPDSGAKDPE